MTATAFEREMLEALPAVRRTARRLTGNAQDTEDLVQDTVVKALTHQASYQLGTKMSAWLCFIARNIFLSGKRKSWRWTPMDDGWSKAIPGCDNPHHRLELKDVLEALQYIPPEQVEALLMIAEGETYDDAAQALGCEVGTLKSRVSRARDAIDTFFSAA